MACCKISGLVRAATYEFHAQHALTDFVDDGQQLTDEGWSDFFQTQLDNIRAEAAGSDEGSAEADADPDNPFHGLPDPFEDELSMPGVRRRTLAGQYTLPLSLSIRTEPQALCLQCIALPCTQLADTGQKFRWAKYQLSGEREEQPKVKQCYVVNYLSSCCV